MHPLAVIFAVLSALFLGIALALPAKSQELHQHTHDGEVGEFIRTWMIPPLRTSSCCDEKDCYPAEVKRVGGTWFFMVRETGEWKPIPEDKLEHNQPDARDNPSPLALVCANPDGYVFCAILGGGT